MTHSATKNTYKSCTSTSNWQMSNIAVMVGGFVIMPPLGFAALAWMIIGKDVDIVRSVKGLFSKIGSSSNGASKTYRRNYSKTGNSAFDTYKEESITKLEEEMKRRKEQLREEETHFNEFVINLQQSKDQAEFNQFMKAQEAAANAANQQNKTEDSE